MATLLADRGATSTSSRGQTRVRSKPLKWSLPGFGPMTRISTSYGEMHAQTLRERDVIRTAAGNFRPIKWIDRILLDADFLAVVADAHSVLIRAGALGNGLPKADVIVSPCQKIAVGRHVAEGAFVEAGTLVGRPGVVRKPEEMMTYTMFHCGEPVDVRMEGLWARVEP